MAERRNNAAVFRGLSFSTEEEFLNAVGIIEQLSLTIPIKYEVLRGEVEEVVVVDSRDYPELSRRLDEVGIYYSQVAVNTPNILSPSEHAARIFRTQLRRRT